MLSIFTLAQASFYCKTGKSSLKVIRSQLYAYLSLGKICLESILIIRKDAILNNISLKYGLVANLVALPAIPVRDIMKCRLDIVTKIDQLKASEPYVASECIWCHSRASATFATKCFM